MSIDLSTLSIKKAHDGLKNRLFSAGELFDAYHAEITRRDGDIHAYVELYESARRSAEEVDSTLKNSSRIDLEKKLSPLAGIPIALKDNILVEGEIASAASNILRNHRATYDATATALLRSAGAVLLGRTNMDDAAMGSSTESSVYGPTKNPHDLERVPGGSSGGSAAAVAAHMALVALGSDTGGSVRQPAALCGVVGLKPTYGSISRHGLIAMASSLDVIGPIGKTVEDVEILFRALNQHDPMDSTSLPNDRYGAPARTTRRIGVPVDFLKKGIDPDALVRFQDAQTRLKTLGYEIVPIDLPHMPYSLAVYYILMPAEASTNLARYDGMRYGFHKEAATLLDEYLESRGEGFGPEVRRRILLGTYVLSAGYYDAYYKKATAVRDMIRREFASVFAGTKDTPAIDAILTPTTPSPAFKLGEKTADPLMMYLEDIFTVPANIAGVPAISVPAGTLLRDGKQLPFGIQLMGAWGDEATLFSIAKDFSQDR
ncbi:MAG: Asp-tRNA(Asn)/Glu-tRNA(Gln) amidotransferase subunit GatA [Patescibacteria group bacterium]